MCVFDWRLFLLARIAGSAMGTMAPGSAISIDVVYGELEVDCVCCSIGYVIESLGGYGWFKRGGCFDLSRQRGPVIM